MQCLYQKFSDALDEKTAEYLFEDYCRQGFHIYNIIKMSQDIDYITQLNKATNGMFCKCMKIIYMSINDIEWLDNKPDFIKFFEQASKPVYLSLSRWDVKAMRYNWKRIDILLKAGLVVNNGIVTNENYKNQNKSINTCTNRVRILIKNASSLIEYKLKNWSISYSNYELIKFYGIEDTIKILSLWLKVILLE